MIRRVLESERLSTWILTATLPWWQVAGWLLMGIGFPVAMLLGWRNAGLTLLWGGVLAALYVPFLVDRYKQVRS